MMIGTETHADIRHVVFSNIVVRDSNKVFGINVQDGATVSDVRFQNVTFETSRRHWNWWGSAEVMKFVLKKRTPESRLGRIEHVTIDGAQGTARGTSLVAGHAERLLEDIDGPQPARPHAARRTSRTSGPPTPSSSSGSRA